MFAVSISLGSTSAYVSVAAVALSGGSGSNNNNNNGGGGGGAAAPGPFAPIKVIANSAGHRNTPVAAALTAQEVLFSENAIHAFVRQPQTVVPCVFSYAAVAAATSDASQANDKAARQLADRLRETVDDGANTKYRGHCALEERAVSDGIRRHGFAYEVSEPSGNSVEAFVSAEDLLIQFLNYVKEHSIDGACGLSSSDTADAGKEKVKKAVKKTLLLTIVAPRSAFPSVAAASEAGSQRRRADAVEWLTDAVRASSLGDVVLQTTVLFSDEAALMAFDSAPRSQGRPQPYFLFPSGVSPAAPDGGCDETPEPIDCANVLVADWGAQALSFSFLKTSGGLLVQPKGGVPYMRCTTIEGGGGGGGVAATLPSPGQCYYSAASSACSGGDALDIYLAEKLAANYVVTNRRMFQSLVPNMRPLQELVNPSGSASGIVAAAREARHVLSEVIPARTLRKLRLLTEEKKIALNTNPQASHVAVEMEAFYEGMDLMDNRSFSRMKFEAAVLGERPSVEHFVASLAEFVRRHRSAIKACKINYALLTGGMFQVPCILQGVRRALEHPSNADVQSALLDGGASVTVLDASAIGGGVAADELFSVGGCLYSYHLARLVDAKSDVAASLAKRQKKRTAAAKVQAEMLRQRQRTLEAVWSAVTASESDSSDDDGASGPDGRDSNNRVEADVTDNHAETAEHAFFLKHNVYLYTGEDSAVIDRSSSSCSPLGSVALPRSRLVALAKRGSALPTRVACLVPAADATDELGDDAVLYLFTDAAIDDGVTGQESDTAAVISLVDEGIRVPRASLSPPEEGAAFVVFTIHTEVEEEDRRDVVLSIHAVVNGSRKGFPESLHPRNSTEIAKVVLR